MNVAAADRPHVLLVDDAESNLYVLSTWLRRAGYEVTEARTGEEALEALSKSRADLVVLDIYLPDMTGYAVCERIKEDPGTAEIPVLHVSSVATGATDRSEGLRRGAEGFLVEPVEREELLATVEALLRGASAQRTASRLANRLKRLNEATLAINTAFGLEALLATMVHQVSALFDAPAACAVMAEQAPLLAVCQPHSGVSYLAAPVQNTAELLRAAGEIVPELRESAKVLTAELGGAGERYGVLAVAASRGNADPEEDAAVFSQFVRAAAAALRNTRSYDIERSIALTLQQSLLPRGVPRIDGLEIVTRYAASAKHAEVGGDFYEMFSLGDGRYALAVGDVVGHSLEAATIMAQLRTAIRCYALEGHGAGAILQRLNALLATFHPDVTATVCCAMYEAESGRFILANAGHLPPLITGNGKTSFLPLGGTLLGAGAGRVEEHRFTLHPGETLLFYTDGLIERPGEPIDAALERLAVNAAADVPLDQLCDDLLQKAGEQLLDDVAIVAIRRHA